jgi:hypothetical protein
VSCAFFRAVQLLNLTKDVKVDGIFTIEDITASMLNGYRNGQNRGETTE